MPSPWQVGHVVRFLPVPWQRGHCTLNFMRPPVWVICPVPLHSGHLPGDFEQSLAVAVRADILPRDIEAHHAAADRCPERNVDLIFEIGAWLGPFLGLRAAASAENRSEDVAEAASAAGSPLAARARRCSSGRKNRIRRNRT